MAVFGPGWMVHGVLYMVLGGKCILASIIDVARNPSCRNTLGAL